MAPARESVERVGGSGVDALDRCVGPITGRRVARSAPDAGRRGAGLETARASHASEGGDDGQAS
eukprot:2441105-Pyramimonas_sp.AAC.1